MTQLRKTSSGSSPRRSRIGRWLAVAAVATSLAVPAAALGASPELPRRDHGPQRTKVQRPRPGWPERTPTELAQRVEALAGRERAPARGFSWADAGIGAGAVAGIAALTACAYSVRAPHPRGAPAGRLIRIAASPESVLVGSPTGRSRRAGELDGSIMALLPCVSPVRSSSGETRNSRRCGAALERAAGGRAQAVLLAGDSGVGKTRLLQRVQAEHRGERGAMALGRLHRASPRASCPTHRSSAALRSRRRRTRTIRTQIAGAAPELARLVPELGPPDGHRTPPSPTDDVRRFTRGGELAQGRLFEQFLSLLADLSSERPVVLAVEDLHWADRSTRDLLSFLIRNARERRRAPDLHATAATSCIGDTRCARSSPSTSASGGWSVWSCEPFTQSELEAQLEGILGAPPDPEFAGAAVRALRGQRLLQRGAARRLLPPREQLPPTIRDALMLRVEALVGAHPGGPPRGRRRGAARPAPAAGSRGGPPRSHS